MAKKKRLKLGEPRSDQWMSLTTPRRIGNQSHLGLGTAPTAAYGLWGLFSSTHGLLG